MGFCKNVIAGVIGGLIGAAVWAAVVQWTGRESGWIAWVVGIIAGVSVRVASKGSPAGLPGVAAVVAALVAIGGGKCACSFLRIQEDIAGSEWMVSMVADGIVEAREEDGYEVVWPDEESTTDEMATWYPEGVWEEAAAIVADLSTAERAELIGAPELGFNASSVLLLLLYGFSPFDIFWIGLAGGSAWRLARAEDVNAELARQADQYTRGREEKAAQAAPSPAPAPSASGQGLFTRPLPASAADDGLPSLSKGKRDAA